MSYNMTPEMEQMIEDAKRTQEMINQIGINQQKEIKKAERMNTIGSVLMFIGSMFALAKLVLEIVLKVNGIFTASIWAILCVGGAVLIPGGGTVSYIISKNVGVLHLSWDFLWVAIALDAASLLFMIIGGVLLSKEPKRYY